MQVCYYTAYYYLTVRSRVHQTCNIRQRWLSFIVIWQGKYLDIHFSTLERTEKDREVKQCVELFLMLHQIKLRRHRDSSWLSTIIFSCFILTLLVIEKFSKLRYIIVLSHIMVLSMWTLTSQASRERLSKHNHYYTVIIICTVYKKLFHVKNESTQFFIGTQTLFFFKFVIYP